MDVVVKAVIQRRAVGELGLGPEPLNRLGHHVGGGVAQQVESVGVLLIEVGAFAGPCDDGQVGIGLDGPVQVPQFTVDFGAHGRFGQTRADVFGDLPGGDRSLVLLCAAVGQTNLNHRT